MKYLICISALFIFFFSACTQEQSETAAEKQKELIGKWSAENTYNHLTRKYDSKLTFTFKGDNTFTSDQKLSKSYTVHETGIWNVEADTLKLSFLKSKMANKKPPKVTMRYGGKEKPEIVKDKGVDAIDRIIKHNYKVDGDKLFFLSSVNGKEYSFQITRE